MLLAYVAFESATFARFSLSKPVISPHCERLSEVALRVPVNAMRRGEMEQ